MYDRPCSHSKQGSPEAYKKASVGVPPCLKFQNSGCAQARTRNRPERVQAVWHSPPRVAKRHDRAMRSGSGRVLKVDSYPNAWPCRMAETVAVEPQKRARMDKTRGAHVQEPREKGEPRSLNCRRNMSLRVTPTACSSPRQSHVPCAAGMQAEPGACTAGRLETTTRPNSYAGGSRKLDAPIYEFEDAKKRANGSISCVREEPAGTAWRVTEKSATLPSARPDPSSSSARIALRDEHHAEKLFGKLHVTADTKSAGRARHTPHLQQGICQLRPKRLRARCSTSHFPPFPSPFSLIQVHWRDHSIPRACSRGGNRRTAHIV